MTATMTKPKLSSFLPKHIDAEPKATVVGEHIIFVGMRYDPSPTNPCKEFDGVGSIRSFSTRHIDNIAVDVAQEMMENDKDIVGLSYFEHGNAMWMVEGGHTPPGVEFQWDGVSFAGIWIPDAELRKYADEEKLELGSAERIAKMEEYAEQACEQYTDFINGNVYGYEVEVYAVRRDEDDPEIVYDRADDYRHKEEVHEDSCWGFFGYEYFEEEVKRVVAGALKDIGFEFEDDRPTKEEG